MPENVSSSEKYTKHVYLWFSLFFYVLHVCFLVLFFFTFNCSFYVFIISPDACKNDMSTTSSLNHNAVLPVCIKHQQENHFY